MAQFWWGGNNKKHHWIRWKKLCRPKEEGGLGIRDLKALELAFSCKLWWKVTQTDCLWTKFMRTKYWRKGDMVSHLIDSPVWKRISRIAEKAHNLCYHNDDGSFSWADDPQGLFSLKSAYEYCRIPSNAAASFKVYDDWLTRMQLLPTFKKEVKVGIVKWTAPPKGRLKLNVDASYTPTCQRGAGILRDEQGSFIGAASFRLSCNSSFQAEVQAAIDALTWALLIHKKIILEMDALEVIRRISNFTHLVASPFPIGILSRLVFDNGIEVSHVLRE
ncbi:unnamed protein product [Cuscuta campestris]|uniref:RNase H type-1 domain-containing protein n=1 Tax=Cuscuta campestris TaxID=132261 RepID=A0A484L9S1_9ASTE|nr:unnamed protein product [Cuscuta campestris]